MVKLVEGLRGQMWASDWAEELRQADQQKEQTFREKALMPVAQHLNPVRVLQLVEDTLPDNPILARWRELCGHSCLPGAAPWALVLA